MPGGGEVVFYDTTQLVARETIAFAAGQCVGYHENFESGAGCDGAYVCQLSVAAPAFELRSGGPAALAAVMATVANAPTTVAAALPLVHATSPTAPGPALLPAAEYTLADFAATIRGAEHMQPQEVITQDVFDRYQGSVIDKKLDPTDPKNKLPLAIGDAFAVTFIGEFLSPVAKAGVPPVVQSFESRALDRAKDKYPFAYTIEILEDVPMDAVKAELAQVIPWYDQPGGGTQMRLEFPKKDWKWQEWHKMQNSNYAKITLNSSPNGAYEVLPNNRARKIA